MNLNETSGCRLCVLGREVSLESVHDTTSKHVISQREAYSRCELDLTNHTAPEPAGTAAIVVAVKRFPIRENDLAVSGCFRLFTWTVPPEGADFAVG